jgi:hypothetical protein
MDTTNGSGIKGLDVTQLKTLMSQRSRNMYAPKLVEIENSDEAGVNVVEQWPTEFSDKKASTVYQGFRNAIIKAHLEDTFEVKQSDEQVYLLHKERVALAIASLNTEAVQ